LLAKTLLDQNIDYFRAYVCEHLGQPDERVTQADLEELQHLNFHALHVLILIRIPNRPDRAASTRHRLFGNPDDAFTQSRPKRGLVTQAEVRALALSQLDLRPTSVVWDIGAGTGSVAIEAAKLAFRGSVYAIEPDPAELAVLQANAAAFGVPNVRAVPGRAPGCLAELPTPDAVFVGATGRQVGGVVRAAFDRLAPTGNLVLNVATIDSVASTHQILRELAGEVRLWQVGIARGVDQFDRVRLQALNPTFLLAATKPQGK
jgi:precorrin-6Y C5,15-methyltransferase (decarboxylating)